MKNSKLVAATSILCLLPMALGAALYNQLPAQMAVQWRGSEPIRFMPRAVVVFGLPVFLCAVHLLAVVKRQNDPARAAHSTVVTTLLWWAVPLLSMVLLPVTFFSAMGYAVPIDTIVYALAGCTFIVLGNYLPKNRRNYTIGIKIPWTLYDEDIWNKTHRLTGYLYIIGGLAIVVQGFLLSGARVWGISLTLLVAAMLLATPRLYALHLYRKKKEGNT